MSSLSGMLLTMARRSDESERKRIDSETWLAARNNVSGDLSRVDMGGVDSAWETRTCEPTPAFVGDYYSNKK